MNLFAEMCTVMLNSSRLLVKLCYLWHVMSAHSVPESAAVVPAAVAAAASWQASSSKRNTKDITDHAAEYCFSASHTCDHACSVNDQHWKSKGHHSVEEASHTNPFWEEIWDLICSHLMWDVISFLYKKIGWFPFWHSDTVQKEAYYW